jgi:hypothetical protein
LLAVRSRGKSPNRSVAAKKRRIILSKVEMSTSKLTIEVTGTAQFAVKEARDESI